ncbi:MAG TPA: hypothetical protein VGK98_04415 [Arthrobacter sp.]|jgi:hypothetical protein|uniref:hypothetical protein n=1 Tax=Arthrobacter sp. TaxID=1667 RepID=UPI002F3F2813
MRRKYLLSAAMLSILLATSACGAATVSPNSSPEPARLADAGVQVSSSSGPEIGTSQRAAAADAKAAKAKAGAAKAKALAAAKAKSGEAAKAKANAVAKAAAEKASVEQMAVARSTAAKKTAERSAAKASSAAAAAKRVTPVPAVPKPAPAPIQPASSEKVVNTAYTTAYTWYDNTPVGSASISHPVLHRTAGGTGTYADPITIAVGHSLATGRDVLDFPAGTRIYLPDVRRYFIVEDTCGDGNDPENGPCHQGTNAQGTNSTLWIDMWIGGQSVDAGGADNCAGRVTDVHTAVFNPASNYVVAPGAGVIHDGKCDAGYGNSLLRK